VRNMAANSQDAMNVDLFAGLPPSSSLHFDATRFQPNNRPSARPTRESVLKRLYEALMRRSLTKVCTVHCLLQWAHDREPLFQRGWRKFLLLIHLNQTQLDLTFSSLSAPPSCASLDLCLFNWLTDDDATHSPIAVLHMHLDRYYYRLTYHNEGCVPPMQSWSRWRSCRTQIWRNSN
jgi:hypothetical protein